MDIFELTPIDEKIDFNIIGRDGGNIFKQCFAPLLRKPIDRSKIRLSKIRVNEDWRAYLKRHEHMFDQHNAMHIPAIEDRFFKLVKAGEKYKYDTDAIMEIPSNIGSTVFETASLFSVKICNYILSRKIRVNNILVNFVYPVFPIRTLFDENMLKRMLQKGINPKVISGKDLFFERRLSRFVYWYSLYLV